MNVNIAGETYRVLKDRTPATLKPGDLFRLFTEVGRLTPPTYFRVVTLHPESRRKRGLPFHGVPSVVHMVQHVHGPTRFYNGRDSWGRMIASDYGLPQSGYTYESFDCDERFDVYRPIGGAE